MSTEGIATIFLTTHNWGRAAKFYLALGYELEFDTGHNSGQFRNSEGPSLFIAEIPEEQPVDTRIVRGATLERASFVRCIRLESHTHAQRDGRDFSLEQSAFDIHACA